MRFRCEAYNQQGTSVAQVIEAADADEAGEKLRRQGMYVLQVRRASEAAGTPSRHGRGGSRGVRRGPRLRRIAMFARQLQVLIASGNRIVESLAALEEQSDEVSWRGVLGDVRQQVEEGAPLSEAVKTHPKWFDPITVSLIAAGEATGKMPHMLDRLAQLARKQLQIHGALIGSLIYPVLLVFVALTVLCSMLAFVLPRFEGLFLTLDVAVPPSTRWLMALSDLLRGYWWALLLGLIAIGFGAWSWLRSPSGKRAVDTLCLRTPQLGRMTRSFAAARIARLLGVLMDSHMPLLEILPLVRQSMANGHYVQMLHRTEEAVTRGEPISAAFATSDLISPAVCQVLRSGEQSGSMAPLLLNLADLMDEENEMLVKSLTSIIEPLILIGLGLLVGFVTLSMFLPLFDLSSATGGG